MTRRLLSLGLLLAVLAPLPAYGADILTPACISETYAALSREQRLYRSVVFGSKKAEDLPVNSLLYDKEGTTWLKTKEGTWAGIPQEEAGEGQAASRNDSTATRDDEEMDEQKDTPTRRGLLEARRTATSDIVPALTQSLRALRCRLRAVCAAVSASQFGDEDMLTVQPTGCIEMELPAVRGCNVSDGLSPAFADPGACDQAADALFREEANLLSLSVSYDASYRTVAQFTGMFEGFLSDFRFPLLNPLWQTVRVLGGLKNIPCFLSQCEE